MKNLFSERVAAIGLLAIQTLMIGFHLLILTGVIPFNIVWGGRLKTHEQMVSFELVSVSMNLLMVLVVAVYSGLLNLKVNRTFLRGLLWGMMALFLLNTIGNLLSVNALEKAIFTPATLLLALFSLRLAISKEPILAKSKA
ncbi:hypothetical protein [Adhaeribacter terreus]|uniref:Uncharacterized protein n=1 Tax=Adhaeribacter terreus TaxID=529703 RepID=A0ABW0EEG8_9BACT